MHIKITEGSALHLKSKEKETISSNFLFHWLKRIVRWGKTFFDINEHPERCNGFFRIHPTTARRLHDDFLIESAEKLKDQRLRSNRLSSTEDLELGRERQAKTMSIEKTLVLICFVAIVVSYPLALYFALS